MSTHGGAVCLTALLCSLPTMLPADIIQLTSPTQITGPATSINFDGVAAGTVANNLYQDQGIVFSRHDGYAIPIIDWAALGRTTTSPPNVIATILGIFQGQYVPSWSLDLSLSFNGPVFEVGAFFGNDQGCCDNTTLSVFDINHTLLGSVSVPTNNNTSVDQFIGLRSTVPFFSARFEHNDSNLAVVLDDVKFSPQVVPEPTTLSFLIVGGIALLALKKRTEV